MTALGQANCRLVAVYVGRVNRQTLKIGLVALGKDCPLVLGLGDAVVQKQVLVFA